MNKELLLRVADHIEKHPESYDQSKWSTAAEVCRLADSEIGACGTRACIAGWACHLGAEIGKPIPEVDVQDVARELLGISAADSELLFAPSWRPRNSLSVPQELRLVAETGTAKQTATAGWKGTATAGDEGTATAGRKGTATAGWKGTATAGDEGTATAGNEGTATAGNEGTATAGNEGTATAGNEGTATAGWKGTATAGWKGTATAGWKGTATAGDEGTATAGNEGTATAGWKGTATAGNEGTATAGDEGTATAGNEGTATAGNEGTATAGWKGTATAGKDGVVVLTFFAQGRYQRRFGLIGTTQDASGNLLEAGKAYKLDSDGKFTLAPAPAPQTN